MFDYLNAPEIVCREGETDEAAATAAAEAAATAAAEAAKASTKTFSQDDVNTFLAEDRRKHQEKLKTLETSYETLIADNTLAEGSRQKLQTELESLQAQFRTKEQQVEHEKQQQAEEYEGRLSTASEAAEKFETLYTNRVINDEIRAAAIAEEAFNADHLVSLLRPETQLQDVLDENRKPTGKKSPMTKFMDVDIETGDPIETLRTPAEAVKRMKELPAIHGCLFRANVVSGVGQGAATGGVTPGKGATIDQSKLTTEQHMKIRKENPALLGLRAKR